MVIAFLKLAVAIASLSYCMAPFPLSICNCGKDYSLDTLLLRARPCCWAWWLESKEQSSEGVQCIIRATVNPNPNSHATRGRLLGFDQTKPGSNDMYLKKVTQMVPWIMEKKAKQCIMWFLYCVFVEKVHFTTHRKLWYILNLARNRVSM